MMTKNHTFALLSGAFFTLMAPFALAQPQIYHNFTGYTFIQNADEEATLHSFTHMVVDENGKIIATGDTSLVEQYEDAIQVNLAGRTVIPGLIDAHAHVQTLGENLIQVDLRGINNRTATVAKVVNYADANLELEWIVGRGWNQELWPNREYPSRHDLDEHINDRPVWLSRVDAHAGWANSMALELAGITADTEDPEGGQILRDDNGEPTGILIDSAMQLITDVMPDISSDIRREAVLKAQEHILQNGITQVLDAGVSAAGLADFRALNEQGKLKLRINAMVSAAEPTLDTILSEGVYTSDNHRLHIGNVKIYGDGALGSRGARLIEPYSDEEDNYGLLVTPEDQVRALFNQVHEAGFQISYHAIGDYTNQLALNEFERMVNENDDIEDLSSYRHRIEHAQIVQVDDIPRFKVLGIIPSMQPTHATSDMNMAESRVGSERIAGAYAWRTFLDQGSLIAAGSDFPVELVNPFYGIHAAVTRQDRNNDPVDGWHPEQALTLLEALRSFTLDAAYSGFSEDYSGSLEAGKYADFIVIDRDPLHVASSDLWKTRVIATYIAGERVFHANR